MLLSHLGVGVVVGEVIFVPRRPEKQKQYHLHRCRVQTAGPHDYKDYCVLISLQNYSEDQGRGPGHTCGDVCNQWGQL